MAKKKVQAVTVDEYGKRHYSKAELERRRKERQRRAVELHPELAGQFEK
jgi:hypothetical protein